MCLLSQVSSHDFSNLISSVTKFALPSGVFQLVDVLVAFFLGDSSTPASLSIIPHSPVGLCGVFGTTLLLSCLPLELLVDGLVPIGMWPAQGPHSSSS
jgi:hypothetical protein